MLVVRFCQITTLQTASGLWRCYNFYW